ncbi:MAG: peptidoglycan DD-metalloendopeptidase family protein [Bacteroidaceae bacterium]|nr:peptidoglycan DD-metalloendopeptidase family protein [Bacteroidaceae bacterium]
MKHPKLLLLLLLAVCCCQPSLAQTNRKIEELKSQRGQLQEQIKQSESLLLSTNKDVKSQLGDLALINSQLEERRKFIKAIESEMAALDADILRQEKQLKQLQADLKQKQDKYAQSVRYLRKSRSIEDKLMFVFSAENFNQMYRRLRYVTEYADYQRLQGNQLKEKQAQVEAKRKELLAAREEKTQLLAQREEERSRIETKEKQQRALVNQLQKRQRNLQAELKKQRQQSQRLNAQIDKLIEQEIAAAKRRAAEEERKRKAVAQKAADSKNKGETQSEASAKNQGKDVPMMAEYTGNRQLSGVFEKNKGRLPMPITGSYAIVSRFGQYAVAGLKNVKLDNKGIDIKGQKGAQARSIFDGEVSAVFQFGGYTNVLVRHGSYISVYCNLSSASVKLGQKLKTHDSIGTVATDASGNTILHFQLRKETTKLNPEQWLGR